MTMHWCESKLTILPYKYLPWPNAFTISADGLKLAYRTKASMLTVRKRKSFASREWVTDFSIKIHDNGDRLNPYQLSANGKYLAFQNGEKTFVYKHDGTTWNQYGTTMTLCPHSVMDQQLSFSADGQTLAIIAQCNDDGSKTAQVYNYNKGSGAWNYYGQNFNVKHLSSAKLSGDGSTFVHSHQKIIDIYKMNQAQMLWKNQVSISVETKNKVLDFQVSHSGNRIALDAGDGHGTKIWDCTYDQIPNCQKNDNYANMKSWTYPQLSANGTLIATIQHVPPYSINVYDITSKDTARQIGTILGKVVISESFACAKEGKTMVIYTPGEHEPENLLTFYDYRSKCTKENLDLSMSESINYQKNFVDPSLSHSLFAVAAVMFIAFFLSIRRR